MVTVEVRLQRGKSEHHRAGWWVTPTEGDFKESATENNRIKVQNFAPLGKQVCKGEKVE